MRPVRPDGSDERDFLGAEFNVGRCSRKATPELFISPVMASSERTQKTLPNIFIRLEDGDLDPLRWRGMVSNRNNVHQFVFFNACDVGQAARVASFVDGWAPAVLETGASGYVGALWPLGDKAAGNLAIHFYKALEQQSGKMRVVSVAEILRETRQLFMKDNDPSYLAYVYYGDPNLKLYIH